MHHHVPTLERQWAARISAAAADALRNYPAGDYEPGYDGRHDHVTDVVSSLLLDSADWTDIPATDISDIAYEAATQALANERERAWAADRAMVADMERDGLL